MSGQYFRKQSSSVFIVPIVEWQGNHPTGSQTQHPQRNKIGQEYTCNLTGLSSHIANGCSGDTGRNKGSLTVTLLDYMDVTVKEVELARHGGGKLCM